MQRRLIISFDELNETAFAAQASTIEVKLGMEPGASYFPGPWPLSGGAYSLAQLAEEVKEYAEAKNRAAGGDKRVIATRKALRAALSARLKELATYLMLKAAGDLAKLEATGFAISRERGVPSKIPLAAPQEFSVRCGELPGMLVARSRGVKGAKLYELAICDGDLNVEANWRIYGTATTPLRMPVTGQTPGVLYHLRVRAINHAGPGAWSGIKSARAA